MKGYSNYDADLIKTASPSKTSGKTTSTGALDLGDITGVGVRSEDFELEISLPALTATQLPSGATLAFSLVGSNDSTFSSSTTFWTTTVGNGTASTASVSRFKPTLESPRYWRVECASTASGSDVAIDDTTEKTVFSMAYVC